MSDSAPSPMDATVIEAFHQAQAQTIRLMREVTDSLALGMSEREVTEEACRRAPALGFSGWFHTPEVRFGGNVGHRQKNSKRRTLNKGMLVEIDLGPSTEQGFGDLGVAFAWEAEEPALVQEAKELCRATSGFANRWKCIGELFVFAHSWANNHRGSLGKARAVGHICLPREGLAATSWPRVSHAATLFRRNQIQWLNPRRMHGIFAVRPRLVRKGQAVGFEEMLLIDGDTRRILGRNGFDEIGTW